jgi:DTW domain-containing protein YfiP
MRHLSTANRCEACQLHLHLCICPEIRQLPTQTRVVIVRHWKEARKPTGSARIMALAMPNLHILDYGEKDTIFSTELLDAPDTWALLPNAEGASEIGLGPENRPKTLVLLDGTWAQARRMASRIPSVERMPRWALETPARRAIRLRRPHEPWARSTAEALAEAMGLLEGEPLGNSLFALYDRWVSQSLQMRGLQPEISGPEQVEESEI